MNKKTCLALILTVALSGGWLLAKKPWEKKFTDWSRKEVLRILNDSPWAEQFVRTRSFTGRGTGLRGEREVRDSFTVRFFTALPVRQAYVRMIQIINGYDEMGRQQQAEFDQKFARALEMDTSGQIIVALEFASNDPEYSREVERQLRTGTADLFKQSAFLISDRLGRVDLQEYYPPAPDGTGAKFVFPRQVDGQPVVSADDKQVKFELGLARSVQSDIRGGGGISPEAESRVIISKKIKDLMFEGQLEL